MKILITGGAGFIGSHLSLALIERGYTVRVLDNLSKQIHGDDPEKSPLLQKIKGKVDFIRGSVTSENDLRAALQSVDAIVHLAAETGTGQSMYEVHRYTEVNSGGTALLLDIVANDKLPIKKMIVASSRAVYGEGKYNCDEHGYFYPKSRDQVELEKQHFDFSCPVCGKKASVQPTDEDSRLHPTSVYGVSKLNQEQMVLTVCRSLDIPAIAFRYQNVYGPGQSLSNPYTGILSIFSTRIRNDKGLNIFEDGKESRDFVFIDDVVNATLLGVETTEHIFEAINVGSGIATDVSTIAGKLQQLLQKKVDTKITGQFRIGDIRHNYADIKKLQKILRYTPKTQIDEGMESFVKWVLSEEIQKDNYERSLDELKKRGLLK